MKSLKNSNTDISNVDEKIICHKDMSKNNNINAIKFDSSRDSIMNSSISDASSRYSDGDV